MTHAAGWYPDATGRHAQRYFDGSAWTDHVADAAGRQSMDPVVAAAVTSAPPRPAAPTSAWSAGAAPTAAAGPWQTPTGTAATAGSFATPPMATTLTSPRAVSGRTAGGIDLTVGTVVGGVGALLALISIFALDYWKAGSVGISLGDIADAPDGVGLNGLATSYAGFGRFLAVLAIAAAVVAVLRLPALSTVADRLALGASGAVALFALWHLVGLFVAPDGGGMAITGLLGVVGLGAVAAAPFLRQPLGTVSR